MIRKLILAVALTGTPALARGGGGIHGGGGFHGGGIGGLHAASKQQEQIGESDSQACDHGGNEP